MVTTCIIIPWFTLDVHQVHRKHMLEDSTNQNESNVYEARLKLDFLITSDLTWLTSHVIVNQVKSGLIRKYYVRVIRSYTCMQRNWTFTSFRINVIFHKEIFSRNSLCSRCRRAVKQISFFYIITLHILLSYIQLVRFYTINCLDSLSCDIIHHKNNNIRYTNPLFMTFRELCWVRPRVFTLCNA